MSSCRKLKQSRVKITQIDDQEQNVRIYFYVKIKNKKVKMQLDSGSDISIINTQTWKNIGKSTLFKSNKIARTVTDRKINFVGEVWLNINFKFIYWRHINQLQKRITDEQTETPQIEEDDLQDLYDTFDLQMPQAEQEPRLKRKRKAPPQFIIDPKRKKILKFTKKKKLVKNIEKQF